MFIGDLIQPNSAYTVSCSFRKRGTHLPLAPDLYPDPDGNALLCGRPTGWRQSTVLDVGVDIELSLSCSCFVDSVMIGLADPLSVRLTELFAIDGDGGLVPIARNCRGGNLIAGYTCDRLLLRLHADFRNIDIRTFGITGAVFDDYNLYPQPASFRLDPGPGLKLGSLGAILTDTGDGDCRFAADWLRGRLSEAFDLQLPVRHLSEPAAALPGTIALAKLAGGAANQYAIHADADACSLAAADRLGLVYAVETLIRLVKDETIAAATLADQPFLTLRGVHIGLPERSEIPFVKRLIKELLVPMRYNTLFIEVAAGMRFDRHPEINEVWLRNSADARRGLCPVPPHSTMVCSESCLEQSEVRDLVAYAEQFGLEVIPEVQSLSHVQYVTMAHPELAEKPAQRPGDGDGDLFAADALPDEVYPSCYCPSNEQSYALMFDLLDEILAVFRPKRYVHMGHDEVYRIGVCPACQDKDPASLFADDVNRYQAYLAARGLGMMIWADMLHAVTAYKTPPAIDKISRDIVLLDFIWYFHLDKDIEDRLLDHGFKVIIGNLYSSHYPRYAERAVKPGMIGAQVSTWVRVDAYTLGMEGKFYDLLYSAGMMWSRDYLQDARRCYDRLVRARIPELRAKLSGSRPLADRFETLALGVTPLEVASPASISPLPSEADIPVEAYLSALAFTHAASNNAERIAWHPLKKIGEYLVFYDDGSAAAIPIEYGGNICAGSRRYGEPLWPAYYRHEGYIGTWFADPISLKTADGEDLTLYEFVWENPEPAKKVAFVRLRGLGDTDAGILLYKLKAAIQ